MFCNRCAAVVQPDFNVCPRCGTPVVSVGMGSYPVTPGQSRLSRHLNILGMLWMIGGALFLFPSLMMMSMGRFIHFTVHDGGDEFLASPLMHPVFFGVGSGLLLLAAGAFCVGWGLKQHEPWARTVAIVVAVLALFHPPFGTALGIYTLIVLAPAEAGREYRYMRMTR